VTDFPRDETEMSAWKLVAFLAAILCAGVVGVMIGNHLVPGPDRKAECESRGGELRHFDRDTICVKRGTVLE